MARTWFQICSYVSVGHGSNVQALASSRPRDRHAAPRRSMPCETRLTGTISSSASAAIVTRGGSDPLVPRPPSSVCHVAALGPSWFVPCPDHRGGPPPPRREYSLWEPPSDSGSPLFQPGLIGNRPEGLIGDLPFETGGMGSSGPTVRNTTCVQFATPSPRPPSPCGRRAPPRCCCVQH